MAVDPQAFAMFGSYMTPPSTQVGLNCRFASWGLLGLASAPKYVAPPIVVISGVINEIMPKMAGRKEFDLGTEDPFG